MTEELGATLAAARAARGWSLQAAGEAATVSPAYLHKLEAGRVGSPNPRLLARLAAVLELSYGRLLELAGYLPADAGVAAGPEAAAPPPRKARTSDSGPSGAGTSGAGTSGAGTSDAGRSTARPVGAVSPTNAELLTALVDLRRLLDDVRAEQARLADEVARLTAR